MTCVKKSAVMLIGLILAAAPLTAAQERIPVAVVSFENLTKNSEWDWVGAGFSETLTIKLLDVDSLRVVEREQIAKILREQEFQMSGLTDEKTRVRLGRLVGAAYLVMGSFQKMGDDLLVNARVVSVESGEVKKAASSRGRLLSLFDMEEELGLKLAELLEAPLTETDKEEMARKPAADLDAYTWYAKGIVHYEKSDLDQAVSAFKQALSIDGEYVDAMNYLGKIYQVQGSWDEAVAVYEKAIKISRKRKEKRNLIRMYNNTGVVFASTGDYGKAMSSYEKALSEVKKGGDPYTASDVHINIGEIHRIKGEYGKAMLSYKKALALAKEAKDQPGMAAVYNNMGLVFWKKGDHDRAMEHYEKSLAITEKTGDRSVTAAAYENIGLIHHSRKEYEKAMAVYKKALLLSEELKDESGIAHLYYNIGSLYVRKEEHDKALDAYLKSLALRGKLKDQEGTAQTCYNLYALLWRMGKEEEALDHLKRCVEIECRIGLPECEEHKKRYDALKNR